MVARVGTGHLRAARLEDFPQVAALERKVGWVHNTRERWEWLWEENPALSADPRRPDIGWVVEQEGRIVGYFGNVPQLYRYGSRTLLAGTAMGLCVDPETRGAGYGLDLVKAWSRQGNVDLTLSTTTNALAKKLMLRLGVLECPQPEYETALYWIIDPSGFSRAALLKKGFGPVTARLARPLLSFVLRLDTGLRRRRPARVGQEPATEIRPGPEFGSEFDDLWARKIAEPKRLMSYRTAQVLRWHFGAPLIRDRVTVVRCLRGGLLVGYAVLVRFDTPEFGLERSRIVDLFAEHDDPGIVGALLGAAYEFASTAGSPVLELMGFPAAIRRIALASRPYARSLGSSPYLYTARESGLADDLRSDVNWYACPYDGDGCL